MNDRIESCNFEAGAAPYSDTVSDGGLDPRNQPAPVGEEVEVVAWRIGFPNGAGFKVYETHQPWAYETYGDISYQVDDLMTVNQHQRIVEGLLGDARYNYQLALDWQDKVIALQSERDMLKEALADTQLDVFNLTEKVIPNLMAEFERLTTQAIDTALAAHKGAKP